MPGAASSGRWLQTNDGDSSAERNQLVTARFAGHPTLTKEAFSLAYIEGVAFAAGCTVGDVKIDDHKVDFILSRRGTNRQGLRVPKIEVQLKATSSPIWSADGETVSFDAEIDLHDELRADNRISPMVLMLMCMPPSPNDWATVHRDRTEIRDAMYYVNICGAAQSTNATTERIAIAATDIVTPSVLNELLDRVDRSAYLL